MTEERNKLIMYIYDHVNDLKLNHRKEVLQMIMYNVDHDKIVEKGNGTQIKFSDMNDNILKNIYNYIYNKSELEELL